jgi:hypothetical protein
MCLIHRRDILVNVLNIKKLHNSIKLITQASAINRVSSRYLRASPRAHNLNRFRQSAFDVLFCSG